MLIKLIHPLQRKALQGVPVKRAHSLHRFRRLTMTTLTYTKNDDGILICDQMADFGDRFRAMHTPATVQKSTEKWLERRRSPHGWSWKQEDNLLEKIATAVTKLQSESDVKADQLDYLLHAMSDGLWSELNFTAINGPRTENFGLFRELIFPALPEEIQTLVRDGTLLSAATQKGHFALLYEMPDDYRILVTDQIVGRLTDMSGYHYLDVLADGTPICRSIGRTNRQRMFFDGKRLMTHKSFSSCAPGIKMSYKPGKEHLYRIDPRSGKILINGIVVDDWLRIDLGKISLGDGDVLLNGQPTKKYIFFEESPVGFEHESGLTRYSRSTCWSRE